MFDLAVKTIIVLVLLAVVAAIIAPNVIGRIDKYDVAKAQTDIAMAATAVDAYKARVGSFPNRLSQAIHSADSEAMLIDPWGIPYNYSINRPAVASEALAYYVWSMGRDNRPGGEGIDQDHGNW